MSTYNNGQYPYYQASAYAQQQQAANQSSWSQGWFAVKDPGYLKGALVGAAVALVVTNPTVQRAVVRGAVGLWSSIQGGFEEMKEQIQDMKSEMSMQSDDDA